MRLDHHKIWMFDTFRPRFKAIHKYILPRVGNVHQNEHFKTLVGNFCSNTTDYCSRQPIDQEVSHSVYLVEAQISNGEMLGIILDEPMDGKFRNLHIDPKNIDTINNHLADKNQSYMSPEEKETTAEEIKIRFLLEKEAVVGDMIWKYERIWSSQFDKITAT